MRRKRRNRSLTRMQRMTQAAQIEGQYDLHSLTLLIMLCYLNLIVSVCFC